MSPLLLRRHPSCFRKVPPSRLVAVFIVTFGEDDVTVTVVVLEMLMLLSSLGCVRLFDPLPPGLGGNILEDETDAMVSSLFFSSLTINSQFCVVRSSYVP